MTLPATLAEIPTPALVLDLKLFESNLRKMADRARAAGLALRPHAKAHKCPEIARRQIATGAIGVCVATVNEAEAMKGAGIPGLLLTSPLADPLKIARIVNVRAMAAVDHPEQVCWYGGAARSGGRNENDPQELLVDCDVGDHRTGAASIESALEVARAISRESSLRLRGIQAYSAAASHAGGFEQRKSVAAVAHDRVIELRDAFSREGFSTEMISGGSTGTWDIDIPAEPGTPRVFTEIQAGSYPFMDIAYAREGVPFAQALTVLCTVVSANHEEFVTVDGGYKAFATDRGFGPEVRDLTGAVHRWGGDEFSYIDVSACTRKPKLGEKLSFLPPHIDPTVNLHGRVYVCENEHIVDIWPVARGGAESNLQPGRASDHR